MHASRHQLTCSKRVGRAEVVKEVVGANTTDQSHQAANSHPDRQTSTCVTAAAAAAARR